MVHVGMRDEDVAHPQKLAGRQTRDVADVKQDRPPLELQVDEYPRVAERPVDERRFENGPHLAENTIRGPERVRAAASCTKRRTGGSPNPSARGGDEPTFQPVRRPLSRGS